MFILRYLVNIICSNLSHDNIFNIPRYAILNNIFPYSFRQLYIVSIDAEKILFFRLITQNSNNDKNN